ncbi:hypothetical protein [Guptibacillus spartinae]|uniref:hypothetical protein n=1 Tax=Guptibacillus spartinae TaxID=3025679 RepID=UPI00235F2DAC|nr:hypothetical protein [Pseudalkalibacillus spartinae]
MFKKLLLIVPLLFLGIISSNLISDSFASSEKSFSSLTTKKFVVERKPLISDSISLASEREKTLKNFLSALEKRINELNDQIKSKSLSDHEIETLMIEKRYNEEKFNGYEQELDFLHHGHEFND